MSAEAAPASLTRPAVRGVAWSAGASIAGRLLTSLSFIMLARLLEPADFGLIALATVFIAIFTLLTEQGFGQALVQRRDLQPEHLHSVFWIGVGASVGLGALVAAVAGPVAAMLHQEALAPVLRVLAVGLVISSFMTVPTALLRRDLAFRPLAVRRILSLTVGAVVGVGLALAGAGVWSLVAQSLCVSVVSVIALWRMTSWRPARRFSRPHFLEVWGFSRNVLGIGALNLVNRRLDDLLIGVVLGPVALGLYSVAYRLLQMMTEVLTGTIDAVALPTFSKLQADLDRMRKAYLSTIRLSSAVSFPAFLLVGLLAPDLVAVLFGPEWEQSGRVMQVLSGIGALYSLTFFNGTVLVALGHPGQALKLTLLNAVTNVIAFSVSVRWGIIAVASAFVARGWLVAPISVQQVRRLVGFSWRDYLRQMLPAVLGCVAVVAAYALLRGSLEDWHVAARIATVTAQAVATYVGVLALVAPSLLRELADMLSTAMPGTRRGKHKQTVSA